MSITNLSGTGFQISYEIQAWCLIQCGMHIVFTDMMESHGCHLLTSLSLHVDAGIFRYASRYSSNSAVVHLQTYLQSTLPANGKPLGLIAYSDKTKLSSFGTAKGYPVMASISNFGAEVRSGSGIGSGRVVGWEPVVGALRVQNAFRAEYQYID